MALQRSANADHVARKIQSAVTLRRALSPADSGLDQGFAADGLWLYCPTTPLLSWTKKHGVSPRGVVSRTCCFMGQKLDARSESRDL